MAKISSFLIISIIFLLLLSPGCGSKQKPNTPGPETGKPAAASSREKTGIDQSNDTKVVETFVEALRTADLKTLKQISKFTAREQTPEQVLKKYGEGISQIKKEEIVIARADLGPEVKGVFFAGIKNDPGFILLAIKAEKIDNKYYVVFVTDDPDYEF